VFKGNQKQSTQLDPEDFALVSAIAGKVAPINELNAENRIAICKSAQIGVMQRNDQLKPENSHRYLMYLVEGTVQQYNGKEEVGTLTPASSEAAQPLFSNKDDYQSLKSPGLAKIAKFGREQLDILLAEQQKNAVSVVDVHATELDNLLFDEIHAKIGEKKLALSSFADNSSRILTSLSKNAGIPELAETIQTDPALSAAILRAAQRAEGAGDSVQTVRGGISRLGVEATKEAITAQLKNNTIICKNPIIEDSFRRYVRRSLLAARLAQVISKDMPHLQQDEVVLNALLADIGELAIITYANAHNDRITDAQEFTATIDNLRTIVSQWILKEWGFPAPFVDSAVHSRDWYRNHQGDITLADVHTAALLVLNTEMPESEQSSIPNANNLLLARRLQQAGIDLTSSQALMQAATGKGGDQEAPLKKAG